MTRLAGGSNKYGAEPVCVCGHPRKWHGPIDSPPGTLPCVDAGCPCANYKKRYDSMAEAARSAELEAMEKAGQIRELRRQVPYLLTVGGYQICRYVADWVYVDCATGKEIVEDLKGKRTDSYRLKARLMWACYGIEIYETGA